jgi:hypothetical protein
MSKIISPQTFKKKQEVEERISKLSGRQARIALLRLISDVRMIPRMAVALDIAETYPGEPGTNEKGG